MSNQKTPTSRRAAIKKLLLPGSVAVSWTSPIVQSVILPAHAQASSRLCTREDVLGNWRIELFGLAASVREITFSSDGSVAHVIYNRWQFTNDELQITQGITWVLTGTFSSCDSLSGTYVNTFTNPLLGNVIIRQGDWRATKLR